ncbi:MAG: ATP phosphoribosyltransferase regulatory subunit [Oscillospiraceae bacterium]|nr:ATP phosphoribosyltransferase regulatory subunit [Oscillospiraceae bacterium]
MVNMTLKSEEKAVFALRDLYKSYGYAPYKMNKFEEYDLYVRNKEFLLSDHVITFTDTNGKLMALKPDVTLSIIKNSKDDPETVSKVYYNENVYRISKGTRSFKELMQVGLECMGNVDTYCVCEVLELAAKSLKAISDDCVLDISQMDIVSYVIESFGVGEETQSEIWRCIGEKNLHELAAICRAAGVSEVKAGILSRLVSTYGTPAEVLPALDGILGGLSNDAAIRDLRAICAALAESEASDVLRLDFSVTNNANIYNGVVFKGFINGIPSAVLSGGEYDRLLSKMGRKSRAIGFAVYLDLLEMFYRNTSAFDVDAILLYDDTASAGDVRCAVQQLQSQGKSVSAQKKVPEKVKYASLLKLTESGVETIEEYA